MLEEFLGIIGLSLSLMACCLAVYFTIWSQNLSPKMPGIKAFGIAATALAVFALVFASYCLAQTIFLQKRISPMMYGYPQYEMKHHKGMKYRGEMKHKAPKQEPAPANESAQPE